MPQIDIDPQTAESIAKIVNHLYDAAKADCEATTRDKRRRHIFRDVRRADEWLASVAFPAVDEES